MGITGAQITVDPAMVEACVRDFLNVNAPRTMVVINPIRVVIENLPADHQTSFTVPDFPINPDSPTHQIAFDKIIYIERDDFKEVLNFNLTPKIIFLKLNVCITETGKGLQALCPGTICWTSICQPCFDVH